MSTNNFMEKCEEMQERVLSLYDTINELGAMPEEATFEEKLAYVIKVNDALAEANKCSHISLAYCIKSGTNDESIFDDIINIQHKTAELLDSLWVSFLDMISEEW